MSNKLTLTRSALDGAKNLQEMFDLEAVRYNAVQNLIKTTGKNENSAEMHYEREKILFFKAIQTNTKLEACDRFTIYSSWIELMASGLSLNEGQSYIIPRGGKACFQIGYKGRLEQIGMMPTIELAPAAQVVYQSDEFDYTLGENPRIIKHIPGKKRGEYPNDLMMYCYLLLTETNGSKRLTIMQRHEILAVRDRYSQPYRSYMAANGKWPDGKPMDLPIWLIAYNGKITDNPAAFKKTIIGRAYNELPKTARMKALDVRIKNNPDPEDERTENTQDITYGIVDDGQKTPSAQTPEVTQPKAEAVKPEAPKVDIGNPSEAF